MEIQLSDRFNSVRLLRFALPSIMMMVFISIYSVVDGFFVGRYVGSYGLATVNIVFPLIMAIAAFGFMLGTGGTATVAQTLGSGQADRARGIFSFYTLVTLAFGLTATAFTFTLMTPLCYWLGASEAIIEDCVAYGRICSLGIVFFLLQAFFQTFFVAAERPKLGFYLSILSGITNILFDWLLVGRLGWGLNGAATATVAGFVVGGLFPILYFSFNHTSSLYFVRPDINWCLLFKSLGNGASEMVTNLSRSLITVLFNIILMRELGENGVAAISVMLYVEFVFTAVLIGFSVGVAPVFGFHFGARNGDELRSLFFICLRALALISLLLFAVAEVSARLLIIIFIPDNGPLIDLTVYGFRLFALSFLGCGINIFASAYFTALGNGTVSALISFLRTLVLQALSILVLPGLVGINGIWLALPLAEGLGLAISAYFFYRQRNVFKIRPQNDPAN
ncbi:MATE family efflux transporter [Eubacteriaceae bacterium ES3]|nr:MATE family efflux transporter [Eubacteriaceae bacterium ES3]